jgi:uncharacterized protein (DUF1499 family)
MKTFFPVLLLKLAALMAGGYWIVRQLAAESREIAVSSSLSNDHLWPCPATFTCVNSDSMPTDSHFIVPIADEDGARWAKLVRVVDNMEGSELVVATDNYVYFTFTTPYLGFVDDIEFHNRPAENLIAVRSAARVGMIDLGNNRRRVEAIRVELGL